MSSQINVRPAELVRLADRCIDWAMDLTGATTDNAGALVVASRDAGNTQGGYDTMAAHGPLVEAASSALESSAAWTSGRATGASSFSPRLCVPTTPRS